MLPLNFSFPQSPHWISDWIADLQAHSRPSFLLSCSLSFPKGLRWGRESRGLWEVSMVRIWKIIADHIPPTRHGQMTTKEAGKCNLTWAQSKEETGFSGIQHFSATNFSGCIVAVSRKNNPIFTEQTCVP